MNVCKKAGTKEKKAMEIFFSFSTVYTVETEAIFHYLYTTQFVCS